VVWRFQKQTRRHGSLRRELKVKTPFNAVEKWFELDKKIFNLKPKKFKTKILSLKDKQGCCSTTTL